MEMPKCSYCGRSFGPGTQWSGSNYCRAAFLLPHVAENPGQTTWDYSQISGLPYAEAVKGLEKAREWQVVEYQAEEKQAGGIRYRYTVKPTYETTIQEWLARALI